jgi:hypothetical protein
MIVVARVFGASLSGSLPGDGFRMFASKGQNGFIGRGNCFNAVSRETLFAPACLGSGDFNDRVYPIVAVAK